MENTENYKRLTNIAIFCVLCIGSVALLGWWIDHAVLASWLPAIANMTFNAALCFELMAIACLMMTFRLWGITVSLVLAASVGLFSGLSLWQDLFACNFAIDSLFFQVPAQEVTSPYAGRMSPNTAGGFLLSSFILIVLLLKKHLSRRTVFVHACILLVLLLSFLGIIMNIFFAEPPKDFVHFASMSLLTAIGFFFLGVAFLGVYVRQYEHEEFDVLMHSGVQLMYNLKYPQKFLLISLVMLIPLAVLMWSKLDVLEKRVQQDQVKIIGLEHIMATEGLLVALPEHRGMLNASLMGVNTFKDEVKQKQEEVEHLFKVNALVDLKQVATVAIPDYWPEVKQRWTKIKASHQNAMLSWRMHSEMIALLTKHLREIGGITKLSYDENSMVHSLLALQLEVLPQLLEKMGRLRGRGAGFLAAGGLDVSAQVTLGAISSDISLLLREFNQLVALAMQHQHHDEIVMLQAEYMKRTHRFLQTANEQLIEGKQLSVTAESYFTEATQALNAGYAFNTRSLQWVQEILAKRINQSEAEQYKIKLSAMLIVMLILYLFIAFYQSVMNTIRALDKAAKRLSQGHDGGIATLGFKDEMGDIVNSFSTVAEELRRVSLHMSAVVDHTADGIITIDKHGVIISFNPAAEGIFSYTTDEVLGQNITMLMPEQYRSQHQSGLKHYLFTGSGHVINRAAPLSVKGLRKDGLEFPMDLSISAMMMDGQQFFIGIVRDVTEQNRIEKQLLHAQKMEVVGALVGGIAHNFNNLLAGIMGKAYLAKGKLESSPAIAKAHLQAIEGIAKQAGEMVSQLLTFARKDYFRDHRLTVLNGLVKESFATAKLGIAEDVEMSLYISKPTLMVKCDGNQIQQVLMNMMNNARDAMAGCAEKKLVVGLELCVPQADFFTKHDELVVGSYACLKVTDTGHGMDDKTIKRIFDPFYTTKASGEGTGLGLSSAFGSVASHGGVIDVHSEVGVGTTFSVYFPLVETEEEVEVQAKDQVICSAAAEMLLLVDDEELVVESMQAILEDLGYRVLVARDGAEGLACFRRYQHEIAVIISDVVMPKMSGVEMLNHIREINSSVPVIFMTGYDENTIQLEHNKDQCVTVVYKPLQIPALSQLMHKVLHA